MIIGLLTKNLEEGRGKIYQLEIEEIKEDNVKSPERKILLQRKVNYITLKTGLERNIEIIKACLLNNKNSEEKDFTELLDKYLKLLSKFDEKLNQIELKLKIIEETKERGAFLTLIILISFFTSIFILLYSLIYGLIFDVNLVKIIPSKLMASLFIIPIVSLLMIPFFNAWNTRKFKSKQKLKSKKKFH